MKDKGAILIIGAPWVGKTLLGNALCAAHSSSVHAYLNLRQDLGNSEEVLACSRQPSDLRKAAVQQLVRSSLSSSCQNLAQAAQDTDKDGSMWPQVLLLECVDELEDAFTLTEVLQEHGLPLLQVLYVSDDKATKEKLQTYLKMPGSKSTGLCRGPAVGCAGLGDPDEPSKQRITSWEANAPQLIEFFSSTCVLAEVAAGYTADAACLPMRRSVWGERAGDLLPPPPSLAAMGYAAAAGSTCTHDMWLLQAGWCSSTGELRCFPADVFRGYRHSSSSRQTPCITATSIEPVVSRRLITNRAERDAALQQASTFPGLCCAGSSCCYGDRGASVSCGSATNTSATSSSSSNNSSSSAQNICSFVDLFSASCTPALSVPDAHWLAVPGRYCVSLKLDGTRHLLIATDSGCYLLNRAGMMYSYPVAAFDTNAVQPAHQVGSSNALFSGTGSSSRSSTDAVAAGQQAAAASSSSPGRVPPGTVLDGELMWLSQTSQGKTSSDKAASKAGYFVVFDALCVAGSRVWQLPLQQRLAAVQKQLSLPVAGHTHDDTAVVVVDTKLATSSAAAQGSAATATFSASFDYTDFSNRRQDASSSSSTSTSSSSNTPDNTSDRSTGICVTNIRHLSTTLNKQQAAPVGSDQVTLLFKPHHSVSAAALQELQASLATYPFPTDGLVFTPAAMPYVLGMNQLLLKWQPQQQAAAAIRGGELKDKFEARWYSAAARIGKEAQAKADTVRRLVQQLPGCLAYECQQLPLAAEDQSDLDTRHMLMGIDAGVCDRKLWQPVSVRWDKAAGSSPAVRSQLEQQGLRGSANAPLTHKQLVQAVWEVESLLTTAAAPAASSSSSSSASSSTSAGSGAHASSSYAYAVAQTAAGPAVHPARAMSFAELYAAVQAEVAAGTVHCTTDPDSGLEVFCYDLNLHPPSSSTAAMCRGLVLHPASSSLVATPFARFGGPGSVPAMQHALAAVACQGNSGSSAASGERYASRATSSNAAASPSKPDLLQVYRSWRESPQASASVKVDGSFVAAFVWQGQLQVATRRRMDSEQAVWARQWLRNNASLVAMQPGWTYMFEAVYINNTHVVRYPFEGLVLLGAVSPDGLELADTATRQQLAEQLGVMAVPCIGGPLPELLQRLGRGSTTNFEGWVVQSQQQRCKLVLQQFRRSSRAACHLLHPLMVWDAVFSGKSRAQLAAGLPVHFAAELDAMLAALDGQFWAVQKLLDQQLQDTWRPSISSRGQGGQASSNSHAACARIAGVATNTTAAGPAAAAEPPGSGTVNHAQCCPVQFAEALQYAVAKGSAAVTSMFMLAELSYYTSGQICPAPALRGRLLECIRPGLDGSLPGYSSSPAFKQTYAKGWAKGPPADCRVARQGPAPLIMEQLTDQALVSALSKLEHGSWEEGAARLVCRAWRDLMQRAVELRATAEQRPDDRQVLQGSKSCSEPDHDCYCVSDGHYDFLSLIGSWCGCS